LCHVFLSGQRFLSTILNTVLVIMTALPWSTVRYPSMR
jgi:hypothetical protein